MGVTQAVFRENKLMLVKTAAQYDMLISADEQLKELFWQLIDIEREEENSFGHDDESEGLTEFLAEPGHHYLALLAAAGMSLEMAAEILIGNLTLDEVLILNAPEQDGAGS